MTKLNLILFFGLLGVLAPVIRAQDIVPVKSIKLSKAQEKAIFKNVIDIVSQTAESVGNRPHEARKETKYKNVTVSKTVLGMAEVINSDGTTLCSAVLFKPWIALTVADCVYGKTTDDIEIYITRETGVGEYVKDSVEITSIDLYPGYQQGSEENNLAMLYFYGEYDWRVGEFTLNKSPLPPTSSDVQFYGDEWSEILNTPNQVAEMHPANFTYSPEVCDEKILQDPWYCLTKDGRDAFVKMDVGSPLFYNAGKLKRFAGIYTGKHLYKPLSGHIYYSTYSKNAWIQEYINLHPVPPFP